MATWVRHGLGLLFIMVCPVATALADAPSAGPSSTCTLSPSGPTQRSIRLTLALDWDEWPDFCARITPYLRSESEEPDPQALEARLRATRFFSRVTCADETGAVACRLTPSAIVGAVRIDGVPFPLLDRGARRRAWARPGALLEERQPEASEPEASESEALESEASEPEASEPEALEPEALESEALESEASEPEATESEAEPEARQPDAWTPDEARRGRDGDRLRDHLVDEGFLNAVVDSVVVSEGSAPPHRRVVVHFQVEDAQSHLLGEVSVVGDTILDEGEAADALQHMWLPLILPRRFQPQKLDRDVDALTARLRKDGWPEARIDADYAVDPSTGRVDVSLDIDSGPRLTIRTTGNEELDDDDVRELAPFAEQGVVDELATAQFADAVRKAYQRLGYRDAVVRASLKHSEPDTATVVMEIEEGQQSEVARIRFEGNQDFDAETLRDEVTLSTSASGWWSEGRCIDDWLDADRGAVRGFYVEQGYREVTVEVSCKPLEGEQREVVFVVREGERHRVGRVTVTGWPEEVERPDALVALTEQENAPFVERRIERLRRLLPEVLAQAGYLGAEVEVRDVTDEQQPPTTHSIRVDIEPGPQSRLGGWLFRGNFRTRERLLKNELALELDDPLDAPAIAAAEQRLRALGIFRSTRISRLEGATPRRPWLMVEVEERADSRTIDAVLRFSTDDRFSVGADLRDRNFLGRALSLALSTRLGNSVELVSPRARIGNRDRISVAIAVPRPFGLPFVVDTSASYETRDESLFEETEARVGASIQRTLIARTDCSMCPEVSARLGYDLEASTFRNLGAEADALAEREQKATIGRQFVEIAAFRLDSIIDPRRGYRTRLRGEIAHPALAGPFAGEGPFWRVLSSATGFFPLGTPLRWLTFYQAEGGGPIVIAGALEANGAEPFGGADAVVQSETYHYGGDLSLRGAKQRASLAAVPEGRWLVLGRVELRWYPLQNLAFGGLQIAGFVDGGTVALRRDDLFDDVALSSGPALRYITPLGPLTVAYGWPIRVPASLREAEPAAMPARGRLHVLFGPDF